MKSKWGILTLEEINGFMFEQSICQLQHRPHRGGDRAKFVGQTIHQLVHVIE